MTDYAAVEALAAGAARGLKLALQAEQPDLAWEVAATPISRAELARLEAGGDETNVGLLADRKGGANGDA